MNHPSAGQFTLKRSKGRKTQASLGRQKPMDLRPRDRSHDALVARWNNTVAPWATGETA
jgi:hypothetical protein